MVLPHGIRDDGTYTPRTPNTTLSAYALMRGINGVIKDAHDGPHDGGGPDTLDIWDPGRSRSP